MSYTQLTQNDRIALGALLRAGHTQSDCARELEKDRSTISRELRRNSGVDGTYHAGVAKRKLRDRRVVAHAERKKLENDHLLRVFVERKLARFDSPEQIAGGLREERGHTVVSHETIYQWSY